jgi:hypothetical protein
MRHSLISFAAASLSVLLCSCGFMTPLNSTQVIKKRFPRLH